MLMLLAASILPACGKSKNAAPTTSTTTLPYTYTGGGTVATSFAVGGTVSFNGSGWMYGQLSSSGNTSLPSGSSYTHTSTGGDQINLVISGSSAYGVVYVSQGTMAYCGGAAPQSLVFQGTVLNSPQAGQFQGFITLMFANGCGIRI